MMASTPDLILYSGQHCCLCDDAQVIIQSVAPQASVRKVDVASDHELYHRYGARIPVVLRTDTQNELGWPFDAGQLQAFLA